MPAIIKKEHTCSKCKTLPNMSEDELRFVDASVDDATFVQVCDKTMSKRSALYRFTAVQHQLPADIVRLWIVVSDETALRNKRLHKVALGAVLRRAEETRVGREQTYVHDSDDEASAIAQRLPLPMSWSCLVKRRMRQKSRPRALFGH